MSALDVILDPATIRERTRRIYDLAMSGGTAFAVHPEKLSECVDFVLEVTRRNYPDGRIPYHGRYEHFRVGGVDRVALLHSQLASLPPQESVRSLIDLVLVSVLLDAGAGDAWCYREAGNGHGTYTRSEGLAVASLDLFKSGAFSHDSARPFQVTAAGLERLTPEKLAQGFQVTDSNPLAGLEGRFALLNRLATSLRAYPQYFGAENPRPGGLIDALQSRGGRGGKVAAQDILRLLLIGLSRMWPARVTCEGVGLGDAWPYFGSSPQGWVPFHKLSQWLTYSLIEPIESAGIAVDGVDRLTGLPEYRNGGLFLDMGVLTLRDPRLADRWLEAGDPAIIEWRALTVQLLDHVGAAVQRKLDKTPQELPLARILQGGTWTAGREVAKRLRPGGPPPLRLKSDGMVF